MAGIPAKRSNGAVDGVEHEDRPFRIEEVGAACVFLASPYAAAMTGETLYIDGGYHILG